MRPLVFDSARPAARVRRRRGFVARRGTWAVQGTIALFAFALAGRTAADTPVTTELEYLGEMPAVLTASRLLQPLPDVPVSMTVIDRATIEASGLRSLSELFRLGRAWATKASCPSSPTTDSRTNSRAGCRS